MLAEVDKPRLGRPPAPGTIPSKAPRRGWLAQRVGEQIRAHRKLQRLTLKDVAGRLGTSPQTVQRLEAATMTLSVDWIERISEALGLEDGTELFGAADSVLGKATARAIKAELELAALRGAVGKALALVNETVPDKTGAGNENAG